jgi:hypothetical protein
VTDMPERIWASNCIDQQAWSPFDNLVAAAPYVRADLPPKVKPLEWQIYGADSFFAETAWGCYFAQWDDEIGAFFASLELGQHEDPIIIQPQDVETMSEAQAAAQADHTARILAALAQP